MDEERFRYGAGFPAGGFRYREGSPEGRFRGRGGPGPAGSGHWIGCRERLRGGRPVNRGGGP